MTGGREGKSEKERRLGRTDRWRNSGMEVHGFMVLKGVGERKRERRTKELGNGVGKVIAYGEAREGPQGAAQEGR